MKVVVVGGGKVGYYLTKTLIEHGHIPFLIESDREVCTRISNELDISVTCGDGSVADVLETAHVRDAEALIAVTGRDQDNLICCQLAKKLFHVKKTVSRINNPKNAGIMQKLGVDIPISSTANIARLLEREVDVAGIRQLLPLNRGSASLSELTLPDHFKQNGVLLLKMGLPRDCVIVTVTRKDEMIIPHGNTQLFAGDRLLIVCADTVLGKVSALLELEK